MKKYLLAFLSLPTILSAQNLVLNPSFEDSLQCPSGSGAFVNYVAVWTKPSYGSADYFYNGCPVSPTDEAPRTGNACGGIICYDPSGYREYMTGHLSSPLVAGTTYTVSYYVSLNNTSMKGITELGAYVSSTNINNPNTNPIVVTPQAQGTVPYTDTTSWQLMQGSFVATGGEQYLYIGSFVPDSLLTFTTVSNVGWGDVYYFVDDVCLIQGTVPCDMSLGISSSAKKSLSVFPNPAQQEVKINFSNPQKENFSLTVYNSNGQIVSSQNCTTEEAAVERKNLSAGFYFFKLESGEKIFTGKFIFE